MKFALIGCGRISTNHIAAAQNNQLDICAICDLIPENMEKLLEKHQLENEISIQRFTDYRILIQKAQPDLVAIATESGSHAEIALACIDAGIPVIIEKPLAMSMEEANKIIERSNETGILVATCHQNRFNIAVQETKNALKAGRFGRLSHGSIHVRWARDKNYYEQASWRGTWAQDGGCLMNQCIHGIDLLCWMLGDEIESVYGQTRRQRDYIQAEDIGMAVLRFKNGVVATVEGTVNVYPKNLEESLYLFGENGTVKIGGTSTNNIDIWKFADQDESDDQKEGLKEATSNVYGNGHSSLYADMIDAIKRNRQPYINAKEGRRALEVILAIYKSQKTGEVVHLPLENFGTLEMDGIF